MGCEHAFGPARTATYRDRDRFHLRDNRIGFVLAAWALYQILIGFSTTYVENAAPVGGVLGGAMASRLVKAAAAVGTASELGFT